MLFVSWDVPGFAKETRKTSKKDTTHIPQKGISHYTKQKPSLTVEFICFHCWDLAHPCSQLGVRASTTTSHELGHKDHPQAATGGDSGVVSRVVWGKRKKLRSGFLLAQSNSALEVGDYQTR